MNIPIVCVREGTLEVDWFGVSVEVDTITVLIEELVNEVIAGVLTTLSCSVNIK